MDLIDEKIAACKNRRNALIEHRAEVVLLKERLDEELLWLETERFRLHEVTQAFLQTDSLRVQPSQMVVEAFSVHGVNAWNSRVAA